jgi:ribonuclease HII
LRWVGIDEAGYGPNLGPLVMTAVVAESSQTSAGEPANRANGTLRFWDDLVATVDRAGGDPARLWVDDSKAILRGGRGRDRLEAACLAAVAAAGYGLPVSLAELLERIGDGPPTDYELTPWLEQHDGERAWPWICTQIEAEALGARQPLAPPGDAWRLAAIHTVIVGPSRFNAELAELDSKASVHFGAFSRLLRRVWDRAADGRPTAVTGDKHGGRHYYLEPLTRAIPGVWIDRGPERAESSQYTIRHAGRRLELCVVPRADQTDGLVALASIVSKSIRELWMDGFNAYWCARVPGLRPSAGYPVDARRFRRAIEHAAQQAGWDQKHWWRSR